MTSPLRKYLLDIYFRLERRITPGLEFSQAQYEAWLRRNVPMATRWLDLGCGHQLLPSWRREAEPSLVSLAEHLVGLDAELAALQNHQTLKRRVCGDITSIPFADGTFDLVSANMVVEHLPRPVEQLQEVYRILKPGGRFVFHTPNAYGYATALVRLVPGPVKAFLVRALEGRAEEDRFETFYRCNTPPAVRGLAEKVGFKVAAIDFLTSSATFGVIPPIAFLELCWIRLTMRRFPRLRATLLVTLERPEGSG